MSTARKHESRHIPVLRCWPMNWRRLCSSRQ
uniref:Uncharacterized protein n=1 Tax=Rhizophora mucronata TaxID=61149 RepID=A0A2P2PI57_RHIMU